MAKHFAPKKRNFGKIRLIIIVVLLAAMLVSGYKVISGVVNYKKGEKFDKNIQDSAVEIIKKEPIANSSSSAESSQSAEISEEFELKINFNILKEKNSDTVGYIYSDGTAINYPIVAGIDNEYYINHRFDGAYSSFGTIFVDYRQPNDFESSYTVLYGHNMDNGSMFAELLKYRTQEYYDSHKQMLLYTPDKKYTLDIFSGYVASTDDFCYTAISGYADMDTLISYAKANSYFTSSFDVASTDKIVLLSTCAYDFKNARFVVFGRLSEITE